MGGRYKVKVAGNPRKRFNPTRFLAIIPVVFVIGIVAMYTRGSGGQISIGPISAGPINVEGTVVDDVNQTPLSDIRVSLRGDSSSETSTATSTGPDGTYVFEDIPRGSTLLIEAEGYEAQEFRVDRSEKPVHSLKPILLSGIVRDSFTNSPVSGASATLANRSVSTGTDGEYRISPAKKGNPLSVTADGYAQSATTYTGQATLDVGLRPNTLAGTIKDATSGKPIKGASVTVADREAVSDESGGYKLTNMPPAPAKVIVTAPGYEKAVLDLKETTRQDVDLRQFAVRALYMTYYGIADEGLRSSVLDKIDQTEANGIVIDIKGDLGYLVYKSDVPMAKRIGAADNPTVRDFDSLMASLKKKNIYTIARIVVFKDNPLAKSRPDLAVIDTRTGKPWIDRENLAWVDPTQPEVWDYNLAIAKEAAKKGFDEIQFDYIRFPTDGSVSTARYSRQNTMENRLAAINTFLSKARSELRPLGVALSVDVFGYTCWREDDMGIGQNIEDIAKHVDFISPMVYPSTYSDGIPDYRNAVAYPYEIVYYSLKKAQERLAGMPVRIRPWLQYFDDYPWATGMLYNAREVQAQKKAAADANALGWLLWDPTNKYARGGLNPK